jgi:threonine/homoserine/homoserine lactone efflux protein
MNGIAHLPAFLLAATLINLLPGPATSSVAGRVRFSAIGVAIIGLASLIPAWPVLLEVAMVCGGLYVAYLGLERLNSPAEADQVNGAVAQRYGAWGLLLCSALILLAV